MPAAGERLTEDERRSKASERRERTHVKERERLEVSLPGCHDEVTSYEPNNSACFQVCGATKDRMTLPFRSQLKTKEERSYWIGKEKPKRVLDKVGSSVWCGFALDALAPEILRLF